MNPKRTTSGSPDPEIKMESSVVENPLQKETENSQKEITDTNSMVDQTIMNTLASAGARKLIQQVSIPTLYENKDINYVINNLAAYKNTTPEAITLAIQEFFRQGGANANISPLKRVRLICPDSNVDNYLYAQEILSVLMTLQSEIKPSLRTLAESMAPSMLRGLLHSHEQEPSFIPEGDLAKVLDRDLARQKKELLTPKEKIGAATYYQWMPDLDLIVDSKRLKFLLLENLRNRKEQLKQKAQQKKQQNKKQGSQLKQKKNPQPAKGRKGKQNMANNIRKKGQKE